MAIFKCSSEHAKMSLVATFFSFIMLLKDSVIKHKGTWRITSFKVYYTRTQATGKEQSL